MSDQKQPRALSTGEGIEQHEGGTSFTTPEAINTFAFLSLRSAVIMRMKHGMSMYRGQEARMAYNYGWSKSTRFNGAKLLAELNAIGDAAGIERSKLDPTV